MNLNETVLYVMDKSKSQNGVSVTKEYLPFLAKGLWGITDLPFLQNKNYQY